MAVESIANPARVVKFFKQLFRKLVINFEVVHV